MQSASIPRLAETIAGCFMLVAAATVHAVALPDPVTPPSQDVFLGGTTAASRPELAGSILVDELQPFTVGLIDGHVQSRVVRSASLGTLDFYWRLVVDTPIGLAGGVEALRLGKFGYAHLNDADWRSDGLPLQDRSPPNTARKYDVGTAPSGAITFLFSPSVGSPYESPFFFLHTDAVDYSKVATYDLVAGQFVSEVFQTYGPAIFVIPEPSSHALMGVGLILTFLVARRRCR